MVKMQPDRGRKGGREHLLGKENSVKGQEMRRRERTGPQKDLYVAGP